MHDCAKCSTAPIALAVRRQPGGGNGAVHLPASPSMCSTLGSMQVSNKHKQRLDVHA